MLRFLDDLPSRLASLEESIVPELTMMVQNHARESGWPREAWQSLEVRFSGTPDASGFHGYRIVAWRANGDFEVVRDQEYGFGSAEPNPAARRMATRIHQTAKFLINQKMRGGL